MWDGFNVFGSLGQNGSLELPRRPPELEIEEIVTSTHAFRELFSIDLALGSGVCVSVCLSACLSACLRFGVFVRLHVCVCTSAGPTCL